MEKNGLVKKAVKYWLIAEIVVSVALILLTAPVMAAGEVTISDGSGPKDLVRTTDGYLWALYSDSGLKASYSSNNGDTWSEISISSSATGYAICSGDLGTIHILWSESWEEYVGGGEYETRNVVYYRRYSSTGSLQSSNTLVAASGTDGREAQDIVCDSNGGVYAFYHKSSGYWKAIFVNYCPYQGSWQGESQIAYCSEAYSRLWFTKAAIDEYNNLAIIWTGRYFTETNPEWDHLFCKFKPAGGSWGGIEQLTSGASGYASTSSNYYDFVGYGNNTFYLVENWNGYGGTWPEVQNIIMRVRSSGSWGSWFKITDADGGRLYPRISVDQDGDQTIIYQLSTSGALVYTTRSSTGSIGSENTLYDSASWSDIPGGVLYAPHMGEYSHPFFGTAYLFKGGSTNGITFGHTPEYTLTAPAPDPDFIGSPTEGLPPLQVQFTYTGTGTPTYYYWTFGDGQMASGSSISTVNNTYSESGYYTVSLYASNDGGGSWENKTGYIHCSAIQGDFSGVPLSGAAPLDVNFTSTFSESLYHIWVWGDGTYQEGWGLTNQDHIFSSIGSYNVKLWVGGYVPGGDYSSGVWENKTNYVVVSGEGGPIADFFPSPETGPAPLDIKFWDTSSGSPTHWLWYFGDGTYTEYDTEDIQFQDGGVWHRYNNPGTYHVSMTCDNLYGFDTKNLDVVISSSAAGIVTINALDASTQALIHTANVEVTGGNYVNQAFDGSTSLNLALGILYHFNVTSPGYYPYNLQFTVTEPITINAALVKVGTAPEGKSSIDFQVNDYYTGSPIYAASSQLGTYGTLTDQQGIAHYLVDSSDTNLTWTISKTGYFAESGSVNILTSQTIPVRLRSTTGSQTVTPTSTSSTDLTQDEREMVRDSLKNAARIIPAIFGFLILMLFMAVLRRGGK